MILTSDEVTTIVEEVETIKVTEILEPDDETKAYHRCIFVYTPRGETLRLWLQADKQEKLPLEQFPPDAWLPPQKYKGSRAEERYDPGKPRSGKKAKSRRKPKAGTSAPADWLQPKVYKGKSMHEEELERLDTK